MKQYPKNPVVAVGALVFKDSKVLLVQRGQEPSKGIWTIPGGAVKLGETLKQAAEREILEETGLVIKAGEPVHSFDLIQKDAKGRIEFHYVIIDLLADYVSGEPFAGDDAAEARWIDLDKIKTIPVNPKTKELIEKLCKRLFA